MFGLGEKRDKAGGSQKSDLEACKGLARDLIEIAVEHKEVLNEDFIARISDSVKMRLPGAEQDPRSVKLMAQAQAIVRTEVAAYQAKKAAKK